MVWENQVGKVGINTKKDACISVCQKGKITRVGSYMWMLVCTAHLGRPCVQRVLNLFAWVLLQKHVTRWAALHLAGPVVVWRRPGFPHYTWQSCVNLSENRWSHVSANPGEKISHLNVVHASNSHEKSNLKVGFSSLRQVNQSVSNCRLSKLWNFAIFTYSMHGWQCLRQTFVKWISLNLVCP